ncbi:MAG: hypothetical protein ABI649_05630 [Gaiellaceae bacterium]
MRVLLRLLLAAVAAAAVLAYGTAGHGLPQMKSHEGMAGSAIGLCLLLVSVVVIITVPRSEVPRRFLQALALAVAAPTAAFALAPLDARARASPRVLQRFRN